MPIRRRVGSVLEWVVAAALLAVTVAVISRLEREPPPRPPASSAGSASSAAAPPPAAVPPGAVSVPVLPLNGGVEVRVGATPAEVAALLGRSAETGRQTVDRGPRGTRVTRFYERSGVRFALVFEAGDKEPGPVVTAIYLEER